LPVIGVDLFDDPPLAAAATMSHTKTAPVVMPIRARRPNCGRVKSRNRPRGGKRKLSAMIQPARRCHGTAVGRVADDHPTWPAGTTGTSSWTGGGNGGSGVGIRCQAVPVQKARPSGDTSCQVAPSQTYRPSGLRVHADGGTWP
jgi:hypothetical protein